MSHLPPVFGITGYSGSGKTALVRALLPELTGRGLRVSTLKHAHHGFEIDQPGKDSYEHRAAGAQEVLVASARRWALVHEHRDDAEPGLWDLLGKFAACDLVLVEGYKRESHPKVEVHRPSVGKPLLLDEIPNVLAVASDESIQRVDVPVLNLNNVAAIADFVLMQTKAA
ncbi:molybdopterin guanine dinucleotide biosynthesis accessory protein MobB [Limimonas halophila]|uniref:Molybdopterin guanine dinucleotide biosynthesis accessory protein MobB n=1 Tax=Limimonas halophila TaxID=1082479 RepID=A0A1G7LTT4_9PROT|nr:molybdopterin-guanine dinucleotide biosynthesis protein B [Limimonas halophila]SDF52764.1 molybdopterin guanine dinucleotide biosynthesis accessory protein MobB [Limimonas halophila]